MYKHILIATDGSELAKKAETQGLALAKDLKAAATAVTVTEAWSALELASQAERGAMHPIKDYEKNIAALAERILSRDRGKYGRRLRYTPYKGSAPSRRNHPNC